MRLTPEQQQLVADNEKLIYDVLHRNKWDIDEYYSLAAIGLCKAAMAYDPDRGKFTTLAYRAMSNEVLRTFQLAKYKKRQGVTVSINEPAEEALTLAETLPSTAPTPEDAAICSEMIERISRMKADVIEAVTLTFQGFSTKEIAKKQGCTHQYISQKLRTARAKL